MKPAPFDFVAPRTVEEACRVLSEAGGGATVMAGGQTLMPLLNLRMSQPFIVLDAKQIEGLSGVLRLDDGSLRVGATTTQREALESDLLAQHLPVLVQALRHVGHHQTRNRGTVGGSVALGEPAAEMPATAVALGAMIEVASVRGTRRVAARDFYLGPYMTVLEPDELVTAITYPAWAPGHVPLFRELAQRPGDFALVGLVGALELDGGAVTRAGLAWFGMGPTPIHAAQAEAVLLGKPLSELDLSALADLALNPCAPFDDHHASADYRRTVGKRLFLRCLREALQLKDAA